LSIPSECKPEGILKDAEIFICLYFSEKVGEGEHGGDGDDDDVDVDHSTIRNSECRN
jgi:hypothetical protein